MRLSDFSRVSQLVNWLGRDLNPCWSYAKARTLNCYTAWPSSQCGKCIYISINSNLVHLGFWLHLKSVELQLFPITCGCGLVHLFKESVHAKQGSHASPCGCAQCVNHTGIPKSPRFIGVTTFVSH